MTTEFAVFGDPMHFQIGVRWRGDAEPRTRRPDPYGWSMGDLRIVVAGRPITQVRRGAITQGYVSWYLAPFFEWLTANWAPLLHEEDYAWTEHGGAPALLACHRALDRWIGATDPGGQAQYKEVQRWYFRHALRSASSGGLWPDLFVRRFLDDIELSWSADQPPFAPDGFTFAVEPGVARLPVDDVAAPLWEVLNWALGHPPKLDDVDRNSWRQFERAVADVRNSDSASLVGAYVRPDLLTRVRTRLAADDALDLLDDDVPAGWPYVRELSPAVLMFGGVSPDLGRQDIDRLCTLLLDSGGGCDSEALLAVMEGRHDSPLGIPHEDGYQFAEDILEQLGLPDETDWIDVRAIARCLGIDIVEQALDTDGIRGVAVAGPDFRPVILINLTSPFNTSEAGRRFTIAHEICHVVHDRTRARRVTHVSGQWVAPGVERRANAFAAYLLMPRALVLRHWPMVSSMLRDEIAALARTLQVSYSSVVEHLHNLDLIDEPMRARLRG